MATFAGLGVNGTVTTAVNNSRNGVVVVRAETEETAIPEGEPEEKVQESDPPGPFVMTFMIKIGIFITNPHKLMNNAISQNFCHYK